ncbi:hypothetical protein AB0M47_40425 [Hamadaea sp. NPDC051192]|uniref:hypothetical protein n=1 Tax=Hamadaea sp. NPDC051192 TaxID=3154940 RepID=UPI00343186AC
MSQSARLLVLVPFLASLALAGCSSAADPAATDASATGQTQSSTAAAPGTPAAMTTAAPVPVQLPSDPCDLVATAKIEDVIDTTVTGTSNVGEGIGSTCTYSVGDGTVTITLFANTKELERAVASSPGQGRTDIPGIGDEAFATEFAVFARVQKVGVSVVVNAAITDPGTRSIELLRVAVDNLQP